jgi:hypothetical protein
VKFDRITFETGRGKLIDIVESEKFVLHDVYILYSDISKIISRLEEFGAKTVDKTIAKVLMAEGLLRKNENLPGPTVVTRR